MSKYGDDPLWADITPILQDDGGPNPLAAILYKESYSEAMSYLRAVMAQNERSERALSLTEDVIASSPAHYTVWLYRAKVLFTLNKDLKEELEWMNPTALKHQKNYQIWHHRRMMIEKLQQRGEEVDVESEIRFLDQMFAKDAKNYHVWSYKQWLVKTFDLWDTGEIEWSESMLETDVRNNSVWNYRWYLNFGKDDGAAVKDDAVREREIEFAKSKIRLAPQNQSPWNYIRGVVRLAQLPSSTLQSFALEFAPLDRPDEVRSSHALDLLADVYAEQESHKEEATKALDLLATRYDPIRANYWEYRKSLLKQSPAAA